MNEKSKNQLGIIGDPINHSLSPDMHNFLLSRFKLNYHYRAFRVHSGELGQALKQFRNSNFIGLNVTIPHKETILNYMDDISPGAKNLRAVNTVKLNGGKLFGFNTDFFGFEKSLCEEKIDFVNQRAIVLGAGGSARSVVFALIRLGIGEILILNRTIEKSKKLIAEMQPATGFSNIIVKELNTANLMAAIKDTVILINTTPVGMSPNIEECPIDERLSFPEDIFIYDLIYNPVETKLLALARLQGIRIRNGLDMLIYQGIESLKIWTEKNIEVDSFLPELKKYLYSRIEKNE